MFVFVIWYLPFDFKYVWIVSYSPFSYISLSTVDLQEALSTTYLNHASLKPRSTCMGIGIGKRYKIQQKPKKIGTCTARVRQETYFSEQL